MLGVLDHDDRIDPTEATRRLGLSLTPLDEALRRCLR
jgi:DNA-binding GntR family transcriptional regulator